MKAFKLTVAIAVLIAVAAGTHHVAAAKKDSGDKLASVKCPVSGKSVKAASAVDYKGGKVYFCCNNCPKAFAGNTAKFAAAANHQLAASGQAKLTKCVFTGKKLNPATKIDASGVAICFCCNGCKGKATKVSGKDQVALLFSDAKFAKGYVVGKKK